MKASVVLVLCAFLCLTLAASPVVPCTSGSCGAGATGGCVAKTVDGLVEDFQPKLNNSFTSFTNNVLTVGLLGDYVSGRSYTGLFANNAAATCSFGTAAFWGAAFDVNACKDEFLFTLPWTAHTSCGFALDATLSTAATAVYRADLTLQYTDNFVVNGQPMSRTHTVPYSLYVDFPLTVDIYVDAFNVSSIVTSGFALTGDRFDPASGTLTLTLTTVMNWPNEFISTFSIAPPAGVNWVNQDQLVWGTAACTATANTDCLETITFDVQLADSHACHFDGDYTVSGYLSTCRISGDVNTDTCTFTALDVKFSIHSSDICGSITVTPSLSGNLVALVGPAPAAAQGTTPYTLGTNGYFFADIRSAGNTIYLQFDNISFVIAGQVGAQPVSLLKAGTIQTAGTNAQLAIFNAAKYFSVYFSSQVFAVPPRASVQYIFNAQCYVTFQGNQKRAVEFEFTSDDTSMTTSTKFKITAPAESAPAATTQPAAPAGSNQVALIAGIVGGVAGVALLTVGVALLIRRYRTKSVATNTA